MRRRSVLLLAAPFVLVRATQARLPRGGVVYYHGPGDLVPGASWWGGLRGYSSVTANIRKCINVRRSSDNATLDIGLINGTLDQTTAAAFAGADVVGTGSISGYTFTFTGGAIGDGVYGGRLGTVITGGSSGAWTVDCPGHISQTVASTTFTVRKGLYVATEYDQSGNGIDLTQSNTAQQLQLFLYGLKNGTLPYMSANIASSVSGAQGGKYGTQWMATAGAVNLGTVFSLSAYIQPMPIGASGMIIAGPPTGKLAFYTHANGPSGTEVINLGNGGSGELSSAFGNSNTTWFTLEAVVNGASSLQYFNGAVTNTTTMSAVAVNEQIGIMGSPNVGTDYGSIEAGVGNRTESGGWGSTAFTPTQYAALTADKVAYWS